MGGCGHLLVPQRGDVSEIFTASKPSSKESKTNGEPSAMEFDLKATLREVQSLGKSPSPAQSRI